VDEPFKSDPHEDEMPVSVLLNPISLGTVSMDFHVAVSWGGEKAQAWVLEVTE
jgi:hypothetical protein